MSIRELISIQPESDGFIAIISPKKVESDGCTSHMMSREKYAEHVTKRAAIPVVTVATTENVVETN
jgi:hypothetical protein